MGLLLSTFACRILSQSSCTASYRVFCRTPTLATSQTGTDISLSTFLLLTCPPEFLRNKEFAALVGDGEIPTTTHFVEQVICFQKNLCALLLKHVIRKSKLVRGSSIFDEGVIRHGEETNYCHDAEFLCDYLIQQQWISAASKPLVMSEYRSFVEKFRSCSPVYDGTWVDFLSGYYELHSRENLFTVFKLCCLSLSVVYNIPPPFNLSSLQLSSDYDEFHSCVRSTRSALIGVPNMSGLFNNPRTVGPIFSLLGKGSTLLEDEDFSVWDVTSSCLSRRQLLLNRVDARYICTVTDEERSWTSIDCNLKTLSPTTSLSESKTASCSKPKFVAPGPIRTGSKSQDQGEKARVEFPSLATATLSVPRFPTAVPFTPTGKNTSSKKLIVKKKDSNGK